MHEMKGESRTIAVGQTPHHGRVELARFPDGSWAIRKGGTTIGVWEAHERAECFRVFAMLTGSNPPAATAPPPVAFPNAGAKAELN